MRRSFRTRKRILGHAEAKKERTNESGGNHLVPRSHSGSHSACRR